MNLIKVILAFAVLILNSNCSSKQSENESIVRSYFKAYNQKDYVKLDVLLADGIEVIDMGEPILNTKKEFIDMVEWGEVQNAKNEILEISYASGNIVVLEAQTNDRIKFFGGKPIKMTTVFTVQNNVITIIKAELLDADQSEMSLKKNAFNKWLESNDNIDKEVLHRLNKKGGLEFKKAIRLFKQRK